jgi:protein-S-isoprenylcysteine O-methyltransferase Ste14
MLEGTWMKTKFQTERADWIFVIPSTLIWVCSLLATAWDFVQIQRMIYRFGTVNALGLGLFTVGVIMRRVAKMTLGKYYSYGLQTPERITKNGIYKYVRHPCYFAMLLYGIGTPLIFSSFYGFLITLAFIPFVLYRMKIEETMLLRKFGDEYRDYMKRSKRLIPFIF